MRSFVESVPEYQLRPKQIEDLTFAICEKKSLNTSHPATGKSGTVSVLAYYHWEKRGKKTVYAMPQSLMPNNRTKMLQFTDFKPEDVVILGSDHAELTKNWTGPTKTRQKKVRSMRVRVLDPRGSDLKAGGKPTHLKALEPWVPIIKSGDVYTVNGVEFDLDYLPTPGTVLVEPLLGPSGEPQYQKGVTVDHVVKDLIAAVADAKVFICTFDFLRDHWQHLLATIPDIDLLLVDEHHLGYKRPESKRTESFYFVNQHVTNFCGMTGSLIDGQLDSAFPALHVIEPRYYGSHEGFIDQHAEYIDNFGRVQGWKDTEKLKAILAKHSVTRTFTECYGEEPVVFFHEKVEVTPLARIEYDKFHAEAMLELEDGNILDGTIPGVAVIRARQILAHPETMGIAKDEVTGKDERLKIFAAEGQKMLVFAALKPEQRRCVTVLEEAGLRVGLINSDVGKPERNRIDLAMRNGELDAIVCSGPTAGVGYDWEIIDHVVFVSIDYQDVNFLQGYRRASRGTRTTTLRVTSLEYEDTIDGRMFEINTQKSVLANLVDPTRPILSFTG
jgi:hypothetical protein